MFDTAEAYAGGKSEEEMWVSFISLLISKLDLLPMIDMITYSYISRGRVIKELGLRRTDLVISTKIFWGPRKGPNDGGLSRKQYVESHQKKFPNFPISALTREKNKSF